MRARGGGMRRALACAVLAGLVSPADVARADTGNPSLPGAYCPIPEPGQAPACMDVAREEYGGFLAEVDSGSLSDGSARQLEADLASTDRVYLAVSSIAYGYYRLAQRAAEQPGQRPVLVARLEHWNSLLSNLYESSTDQPKIHRAVREAAEDLDRRAPRDAAPPLLTTLQELDGQLETRGVRGALNRLVQRLRGEPAQ